MLRYSDLKDFVYGLTLQDTLEKYICCLYFTTTVFITVGFGIATTISRPYWRDLVAEYLC
jgi:hypothetical protein